MWSCEGSKIAIYKAIRSSTPHNQKRHINRKMLSSTSYERQGFWLATERLSKGRFRWWPQAEQGAKEPTRALRVHQAQVLLPAGNPDVDGAPEWRRIR